MFYTMLSCGRDRKNIKLNNFDEDCIVANKSAVTEMGWLRNTSVLDYPHPLKKMKTATISYLNIVKWTLHITHFLSDSAHSVYSTLLCFTETNVAGSNFCRIKVYLPEWDGIHEPAGHGLAICYNTKKVKMLKLSIRWRFRNTTCSVSNWKWNRIFSTCIPTTRTYWYFCRQHYLSNWSDPGWISSCQRVSNNGDRWSQLGSDVVRVCWIFNSIFLSF